MNADQTLVKMPTIGFGTYLIPNEEAQKTIKTALKIDIGILILLRFTEMRWV